MPAARALVRRLAHALDHVIGWLLIAVVLLNTAAVFMRYVMLDSISWSEEGIRYIAVWITFLGGVTASWFDEHLDMNMLGDFGGPWFQSWHKALLQALAAVFGAVVFWQGFEFCRLNGMQTAPTTGLPMIWIYAAIPIGGALLVIVSLTKIYDAFVPPAVSESGSKAVMTVLAVALVVLLLLGLPIAFSFGLAAIIALLSEDLSLLNVASRMFAGVDSFVLLAAPFYIVAGELMNRGGISDRLIQLSMIAVGRIRGGTAYAAIVAAVLFSGISGTAVADIAALGQIFIRSMPREGYSKAFAAALVTAGSVIGPIIPPSVIMVLYAAVADVSVLKLFLGGVVPGLLLGVACGVVVFVKGLRGGLPVSSLSVPPKERPRAIRDGLLVLSLPGFIVFGTLSGVFTPTEAGGIAVVYSVFLGTVVFRHLDLAGLFAAFRAAARLTAALFMMIAAVEVVNYVLILGGVEDMARDLLTFFKGRPYTFMLACVAALLIIGLALDAGPALLLLAPVLLPLSRQMGIDDIQFSMVMIVSCTLGLISPPVGICLFVACRIGEMSLRELWTELRWFFYAEIGVIALLVFFPVLSTGLPNWLRP